MKKTVGIVVFALLAGHSPAMAANLAVVTSPPTLLSFFILLVAVGCLVGASKVVSLVRGGQLVRSWQIFMVGFMLLAVCQLAVLVEDFEIFSLPSFVVPALLFLMAGFFLYGIYEMKRTLD